MGVNHSANAKTSIVKTNNPLHIDEVQILNAQPIMVMAKMFYIIIVKSILLEKIGMGPIQHFVK